MVALCACNSKPIQVKASLATIKDCWKAIGKYYPTHMVQIPPQFTHISKGGTYGLQ